MHVIDQTEVQLCGCGPDAIPDSDDLHCCKCGQPAEPTIRAAALREARINLGYRRLAAAVDWVRDHPESHWTMPREWLGAA